MQLSDGVILKTGFQAKFYAATETTHCRWGQELHYLQLDCKVPVGQTYVHIDTMKIF